MRLKIAGSLLLLCLALPQGAFATCKATLFNPVTDVCWSCIFPLRIGSITLKGGPDSAPDNMKTAACTCGSNGHFTIGLTGSFWEPARMIETVKDAYCFPSMGVSMSNPQPGFLSGDSRGTDDRQALTFQQAHYYVFPIWAALSLFLDFPCLDNSGFDLAYMTEVDPLWGDDTLAFLLNPEALLFGNPIAQASCAADSVAVNTTGATLDPLFWCMGSWGSAYPLTGSTADGNPTTANAGLAARMLFKLGREMLLFDTGINECGAVPTPVWMKHNYRLQIVKPSRGNTCIPIGSSDFLWGSGKNPAFGTNGNSADNFLWMMFRKKLCCVGYSK